MASPPCSVCVFCSSSAAIDPAYVAAAREVGLGLAARGHQLVWGGASVGLMGEVARAAREAGARTVGVIPEAMFGAEVADPDADELIVTVDMGARKAEMARRSDAFLVLPGGFGTLEEAFEQLTLRLLGYHDKPIVLVDVDGFWGPLVDLFEHLYRAHFARPESRAGYVVVESASEALDQLDAAPSALPSKWL
ncbi:MAG: TIGR00730 family Rossman fold protein [Acidimicrobiales bacterium]|nr:TIGR00730 family Rossman fold protein [Acidimicrobiales bacterium]